MYAIDRKDYGFCLTFGGFIKADEMRAWAKEGRAALQGQKPGFGVYVDMRSLKPLSQEVQEIMVGGQQLFKQAGMERSAVLVNSVTTAMQFKRLAKESGIYQWERYVSATDPQAEQKALAWVRSGQDPDA